MKAYILIIIILQKKINSFLRGDIEIASLSDEETIKLPEIFIKNSQFLQNICQSVELLKHSQDRHLKSDFDKSLPGYEIFVKRNNIHEMHYFIIMIENKKNKM